MESKVGIEKEVDALGRIVIPKDIRERFGIDKRVEIILTEEGVLLRSPRYALVKISTEETTDGEASNT